MSVCEAVVLWKVVLWMEGLHVLWKESLWNKSCLKLDSKREAGVAQRKVGELERQWWWLLVMETSILGRRRRVSVAGGKRGISVPQTLSDFCIAAFSLAFIYIFLLSFLALLRLIWDDSGHVDDLKWPTEQRRACKGLMGGLRCEKSNILSHILNGIVHCNRNIGRSWLAKIKILFYLVTTQLDQLNLVLT